MHATAYTKGLIAHSMLHRGHHFFGGAIVLRREGAHEFVVLHLLCQGLEIFLKALLLLHDYDQFKPKLKYSPKTKSGYGHNLESLAADCSQVFGLHPMRGSLAAELKLLNSLYTQHLLRYASAYDVLVGPNSVHSALVLRRFGAAVRLAARSLKRPCVAI
jgi:hypothetical protein